MGKKALLCALLSVGFAYNFSLYGTKSESSDSSSEAVQESESSSNGLVNEDASQSFEEQFGFSFDYLFVYDETISELLKKVSDDKIDALCNNVFSELGLPKPSFVNGANIKHYAASDKRVKDIICEIKQKYPKLKDSFTQYEQSEDIDLTNASESLHKECAQLLKYDRQLLAIKEPFDKRKNLFIQGVGLKGMLFSLIFLWPFVLADHIISSIAEIIATTPNVIAAKNQLAKTKKIIDDIYFVAGQDDKTFQEILDTPDKQEDLNGQENQESTVLHKLAAQATVGSAELLEYIVEKAHQCANTRDSDNRTPLHLAIKAGHSSEVIDCLIGHQGNIDAEDCFGRTALHYAIKHDCRNNVVTSLRQKGASATIEDFRMRTPIYYAFWTFNLGTAFKLKFL